MPFSFTYSKVSNFGYSNLIPDISGIISHSCTRIRTATTTTVSAIYISLANLCYFLFVQSLCDCGQNICFGIRQSAEVFDQCSFFFSQIGYLLVLTQQFQQRNAKRTA